MPAARRIIENNGVDLRYFSIIYDVIDQVKQVASGLLGVEIREEIIGIAEVRDVFRSSKFGAVAGSHGHRGHGQAQQADPRAARQRGGVRGRAGIAAPLQGHRRRSAQSAPSAASRVKAYNDVQPGDQIECFERIEVQRTL